MSARDNARNQRGGAADQRHLGSTLDGLYSATPLTCIYRHIAPLAAQPPFFDTA